ncbi:hypothetical protein THMIRHAM_19690 [Thiomicrorhabdus immobilis]|uniref:Diguanylate cyclase/phosphodiesterase n=1 Tax=Thiomicrorhabdus immobilis TaxID=2791037 RepID=A0ABN6CZT8_9GAMM|nr:EAL domain-containing protein [Thiomicrorhabdus immobilis]BCN94184.1 hypothetical protein THMIRHAM_19690 [Thiomicrorhabdus immobilis]
MKTNPTSEKAFFKLQLTSSLGFTLLLSVVLTLYFLISQWHSYQSRIETYKQNYIASQEELLYDVLEQEYQYITTLIKTEKFDTLQQSLVLKRLNKARLGPKKTGYFFVLKLNNINGGADFARHLLLPLDPSQIDQPMDSLVRDEMGNPYRQDYLAQLKKSGIAKVHYWYQKPNELKSYPKVSMLRWIKPVDWIIGAGIYSDELEEAIQKEEQKLKSEFIVHSVVSIVITALILFIATGVTFLLQSRLKKGFKDLKSELCAAEIQLKELNDNLAVQVNRKTLELQNLYQKDAATQLFNRSKLLADIEDYTTRDNQQATSFVLLNIDSFREMNELFGNPTGDLLLKALSLKLKSLFDDGDKIYRVSGDEFLVWLNQPIDDLTHQLPQLHHQLTEQIEIAELENIYFNLTIVAVYKAKSPLSELEMTMRWAKQKGLNWLVYDSKYNQRQNYLKNLNTTELIKQAIIHDKVIPVFQPIYNIRTGKIEKYECLIRIQENNQLLSPSEFLSIAQKSKLYPDLMQRMLEKSFAKFEHLPYEFSINLSYQDIEGTQIPKTIERLLTPEIAPRVIFEILETEGIENYAIVSEFIGKMKALGCRIAIDDYGSGYSNLEYLLKLQIDFLKIDGTLIENLPNEHSLAIIKSIVFFAQQLNISTIAEFVSDHTLFDIVSELGVDFAQGYYIGQPAPELNENIFPKLSENQV